MMLISIRCQKPINYLGKRTSDYLLIKKEFDEKNINTVEDLRAI